MILACALLATAATAQTGPPVPPGACNVWQVCQNHSTLTQGTAPDTACQDAHEVTIPVFVGYVDDTTGEFVASGYEPSKMNSLGTSNLATACPFYDADELLCCNSDTASIMVLNFQQLDGVFATDCPVCAANLKRMWCEYACNPVKGEFLTNLGIHEGDNY